MRRYDVGLGRTGIGENFAKARLALAKRAGYLPTDMQTSADPGTAVQQWRSLSKNLAADSRRQGFANPMQFLRAGAQGQLTPPVRPRLNLFTSPVNSLAYANSTLANMRTAMPAVGGQTDPRLMLALMKMRGRM